MRRRTLILGTLVATPMVLGLYLKAPPRPLVPFADFDAVRHWLGQLAGSGADSVLGWPLPRVLEHCAQSIDYSRTGFPRPRPAWFQRSIGALAFAGFRRNGRMRHSLTEPIPGAPPLVQDDLVAAVAALMQSIAAFERHRGTLAPHFAYGTLDRAQYTSAHLMHLNQHASVVHRPTRPPAAAI